VASIAPESAGLLVDTSAWIELFRRHPRPAAAEVAGELDRAVTCLPVIQEVLQGFGDESLFRAARTAMYALPCVESPLSASVVEEAVELYRRARRAGLTVRSSVDCLIAACAIRHQLAVVHCDRDFAALAKIAPLEHHDIGRPA
jgi:predicted nucleic acid-binding protein